MQNTSNLHLQRLGSEKKQHNYKMASWTSTGSILEASKPGVFVNPYRANKVAHKKKKKKKKKSRSLQGEETNALQTISVAEKIISKKHKT